MNKPRIAEFLTKAGVALWLGPLVLLVGTFVPALRPIASMPVLDFLVFAIIWAYILVAPAAAIAALRLSERGSKARRLAKVQLVVWGLAFVASMTLI
jgi:hypothetical protein